MITKIFQKIRVHPLFPCVPGPRSKGEYHVIQKEKSGLNLNILMPVLIVFTGVLCGSTVGVWFFDGRAGGWCNVGKLV